MLRLTAAESDEVDQFVGRELRGLVGSFEDAGNEIAFGSVELQDLFLDRKSVV